MGFIPSERTDLVEKSTHLSGRQMCAFFWWRWWDSLRNSVAPFPRACRLALEASRHVAQRHRPFRIPPIHSISSTKKAGLMTCPLFWLFLLNLRRGAICALARQGRILHAKFVYESRRLEVKLSSSPAGGAILVQQFYTLTQKSLIFKGFSCF